MLKYFKMPEYVMSLWNKHSKSKITWSLADHKKKENHLPSKMCTGLKNGLSGDFLPTSQMVKGHEQCSYQEKDHLEVQKNIKFTA